MPAKNNEVFCNSSCFNHLSSLHCKMTLTYFVDLLFIMMRELVNVNSELHQWVTEQLQHPPRWWIRTLLIGHCIYKLNRNVRDWFWCSTLQNELWCNMSKSPVNVMLQSTLFIHVDLDPAKLCRVFEFFLESWNGIFVILGGVFCPKH